MTKHSHHRRHGSTQHERDLIHDRIGNKAFSNHRDEDLSMVAGESAGLSPAQRYAAFRSRQAYDDTLVAQFARSLPFELDPFQLEANRALENGQNVLVAAPTGAGKTVIADFAMYLAREHNVKAFYTTPIKALSNQKYHDLCEAYGADNVGLLTGDTSINSEANIVVMTTEVLRNMLYENSETLRALRYVILDEVHYLADQFRGPVWEEVIIHLPKSIKIVALSATVSNVEDFCSWIRSVRGPTKLVVSEHRPVPLEQHVMVQRDAEHEPELFDLYQRDKHDVQTAVLNTRLLDRIDQLDRLAARNDPRARSDDRQSAGRGRRRRGTGKSHAQTMSRHHPQRRAPRRSAVVDEFDFLGMLPGIYFIFSRNGCDEAVQQCLDAGLELTTDDEVIRIRRIVDEMVEGQLPKEDLKALDFARFRFALEEGFAPHHAGMVALFRQIVERLFDEGLVKMVFATETLALGINMPARCVVVEKLEKFNGVDHVALTPGEFTQLTGRAGRRGIDSLGHAVVVDHRGFVPTTAASLSSKRVYPIHSSFKPTFNMAVNLLNSSSYDKAHDTLDHSFAQWEANASASSLESRMSLLQHSIVNYEHAFRCSMGDFKEFMTIRRELSDLQRDGRRKLKRRQFSDEDDRRQAYRELDSRIAYLKQAEADHPCRSCPDLDAHLKWGNRWLRERKELTRTEERYDSRTGSVARQFDRICAILTLLGYLDPNEPASDSRRSNKQPLQKRQMEGQDYLLTKRGQLLRHLYSEYDLVLAEAIENGVLSGLDAPELAAVLSSLVYQSRRGSGNEPRRYPGGADGQVAQACATLRHVFGRVSAMCDDAGLEPMEPLNFGLVDVMHDWANGRSLSSILMGTELTGGDFVRNAKRLADILRQIAAASEYYEDTDPSLGNIAHQAAVAVNRDIVAYSGVD